MKGKGPLRASLVYRGGEGEKGGHSLQRGRIARELQRHTYGVRAGFSVLFRLVSCVCRIKMKSSTFDLGPLKVEKVLCVLTTVSRKWKDEEGVWL